MLEHPVISLQSISEIIKHIIPLILPQAKKVYSVNDFMYIE